MDVVHQKSEAWIVLAFVAMALLAIDEFGLASGASDDGAVAAAVFGSEAPGIEVREPALHQPISVGFDHVCGLTAQGEAYCWGRNDRAQVGDGSRTNRNTPTRVTGDVSFEFVSAGRHRTCGLTAQGEAYCWGSNQFGALGDGTEVNREEPTPVAGGLSFRSISVGGRHVCGVTEGEKAYCWGANHFGRLGDGTEVNREEPTSVASGLAFTSVSAGAHHTCGVTEEGRAYCWGPNYTGQVGDGERTISRLEPTRVSGDVMFETLSVGYDVTCGLTSSGEARCWGVNHAGSVGDGTDGTHLLRTEPTAVRGELTFQAISVGYFHTCGIAQDGATYCWGLNDRGQVGDGSRTNRNTPTRVAGDVSFEFVSAGRHRTCGVTAQGEAYCWGRDPFQGTAEGDILAPARTAENVSFGLP